MLLSKWLTSVVRYEKAVAKEAWPSSLTRHTWWKAVSAVLVVTIVNGILISDLDTVLDESRERHGLRAATLAFGVALMAFVSMMPKANRRLTGQLRVDSKYVALEGGMRHMYLETIGVNIAGGTADVQRNIIATRGLGLPRGA